MENGMKILTIVGHNITDIPSFYDEINRVFMADVGWTLGQSLDAFNDMLHGGYGAIAGNEPIRIVWQDIGNSRLALGLETTRDFLQNKLLQPEVFNADLILNQLSELDGGAGKTYFEIIIEIIADHPNIELVPA